MFKSYGHNSQADGRCGEGGKRPADLALATALRCGRRRREDAVGGGRPGGALHPTLGPARGLPGNAQGRWCLRTPQTAARMRRRTSGLQALHWPPAPRGSEEESPPKGLICLLIVLSRAVALFKCNSREPGRSFQTEADGCLAAPPTPTDFFTLLFT